MIEWVLILTMWSGSFGGHAAIHSVEFSTEKQCELAAKIWKQDIKYAKTRERFTTICTPRSKR